MKIAVLGTPGAWSTERLGDALRRAGAEATIVDLAACALRLPEPGVWYRGKRLALDAAIVKKIGDTEGGWAVRERIQMLRHLALSGVPVWSEPDRLEVAVDRYRMTVELVRAGLPVPETVVTEDDAEAAAAVARFGAAVLKPLFTSEGRGMQRLDPALDLPRVFARHRDDGAGPLYLQRFIKHPGRDLGVAVLDGRCIGAYWRIAGDGQWMTTTLSGGRYAPADAPPEALRLAERAAAHFGLLFTGVDLIETDHGFVILEVSAFGGFRGLLEGCGVEVAPMLAASVLARVRR